MTCLSEEVNTVAMAPNEHLAFIGVLHCGRQLLHQENPVHDRSMMAWNLAVQSVESTSLVG